MRPTLAERVCRKIQLPTDPDECWPWVATRTPEGYGLINDRKNGCRTAHRVVYEMFVGPIPPGLQIDHLCRNRSCVNPAHLEPVTARENTLRGTGWAAKYAKQTHCKRGHPFDEANTRPHKSGGRECKRCNTERKREQYRKGRLVRLGIGVGLRIF